MRRFLTVFTLSLLLAASPALASNMGFKLVRTLYPATGGSFGNNYVSVPWFVSYPDAQTMFNDIPSATIVLKQVTNPAQATGGCGVAVNEFEVWENGGFFDCNFAVGTGAAKGEGYVVRIGGASTVNWVVVGSHDDVAAKPLYPATGGSFGNNYISIPYHTNKLDVDTLFNEIPSATIVLHQVTSPAIATAGCGVAVNEFEVWEEGGFFDCNFPIRAGETYVVRIGGAATLNWTPAHY